MIYAFFLFVFVQKSFLTKKLFLFAEINLTTRGPLYTCLVEAGFLKNLSIFEPQIEKHYAYKKKHVGYLIFFS